MLFAVMTMKFMDERCGGYNMADSSFLTDVKTLRERARRHIERGAVTEGYQADREVVLKL